MPPSLEAMEDLIKQRQVTISLSDVNEEEPFSHRIITLKSPDWSVEIGRGNSIDQGTIPGPDNAWFTSKVVSRHHATIKAHPRSMILTIEDNNSMHGTYLNGATVKREAVELLEGDEITFGTDIVRHSETFCPLKTRITYEWMEEDSHPQAQPVGTRNTFTADYSDQDIFSDIDDEVEIVRETVRQPSIECLGGGRVTKPAAASSSTNSPSTNSVKSNGASSATTTRIDLSVDEDDTSAKPASAVKTFVDVEDSEEDDMDDYSEQFSVNDVDDDLAEDSEAEESTLSKVPMPSVSSVVAAEKSLREPSPSDAALPALRSVAPPRIQSVPSLASLMPPPPPSFLSSTNDESYRSPLTNMSPFSRGFCGTNDIAPTSYQSPPPFVPSAPFGYDFSAMHPPSPLRAPSFTNYGSSWAYPSVHMPQPPAWTESPYTTLEGMYRPNKRKADSISSDSEEDFDDEPEQAVPEKVVEKAWTPAEPSYSPPEPACSSVAAESEPIKEVEAVVEAIEELSDESFENHLSAPEQEAVQDAGLDSDNNQETPLLEVEDIEPPRKRLRITVDEPVRRVSTVRTVAKYAATASAGAVVGAVGVIIGLASLPPDYFV